MKWKKTEIAVLGLLGVAGIVAVIALFRILSEYKGGNDTYDFLQGYAFLPEEPDSQQMDGQKPSGDGLSDGGDNGSNQRAAVSGISGQVYYGQSPQVDFESLRKLNGNVVGWIYGPGTKINYPVVQGEDNDYYLNHMFDGKENKCGSIFMDSLNAEDFSNDNSIVHGHHMRNGSMFAGLTKYAAQSYYDAHPVMWLVTPEKSYQVEIFTGFVTSADSGVWQIEFASQEEYGEWLAEMKEASSFESGVEPDTKDHIITLATCSYENSDSRFVVMGILREQQTQ